MSKKDFIEQMNKQAKEMFNANHIEFKEFKGYSQEGFNYCLHIANYTEPQINIQYFKFDADLIKQCIKGVGVEEKVIKLMLNTTFTKQYLRDLGKVC